MATTPGLAERPSPQDAEDVDAEQPRGSVQAEELDETLRKLLTERRTLVVVGPGGVGKTTTSAAFALQAARLGLEVLVLTVDPAKRLATAMGLPELGNEAVRIDPSLFSREGLSLGSGALHAMMLDTKSTFDALIERHAPSDKVRQRIMANPFYEQASTALAGSQEYMAMEKLYELRETSDYDLIVLDTPPTSNALDFLTAPNRLEDFLDSGAVNVLIRSARTAGKLGLGFLKLNRIVLKGLNRFVGTDTFVNLLDFIESFQEMYSGFKARAARVKEILRSDDVAFVLVSSTETASLDESLYFHRELRASGMPFGALLVNRVRSPYVTREDREGLEERLDASVDGIGALQLYERKHLRNLAAKVAEACDSFEILAEVDAERVEDLRGQMRGDHELVVTVPLFDQDIHSLGGLANFADVVFDDKGA